MGRWIKGYHRYHSPIDAPMPSHLWPADRLHLYDASKASYEAKMEQWRTICAQVEKEFGYVSNGLSIKDRIDIEGRMREVINERWKNRAK